MEGRFISYLRVSRESQRKSGLGLEAQRKAVEDYLNGGEWELISEYVEIESGGKDDRCELGKALRHAELTNSTLLIAKLDRLSRNAAFLLRLQQGSVKFVAVDMPDANNLTIGIMALVAQQEREAISRRTKEALAAAKARGQQLGNPNASEHMRDLNERGVGIEASSAIRKMKSDDYAMKVIGVIDGIQATGIVTLGAVAEELNRQGILSPRGGTWHKTSVSRVMKRARDLRKSGK